MPVIGRLFRPFRPREPDYYDDNVHDFLVASGEDPGSYDSYVIVPKRLDLAVSAIKRYDRVADPFSDLVKKYYNIAEEWLDKEFGPYLAGSRVCSFDEIMKHLWPLKSPGYPWTLKYMSKLEYWMSEDDKYFEKYWDVLSTPDYYRTLCSVVIKEEMRSREKLEEKSVRTIVSMDVNHIVAHLILCKDQNERLINTHLKHSSALGINLFSGGFNNLNNKMSKHGDMRATIELDGKKFDGRFRRFCFEKIRNFRFKCLSAEYRTPENFQRLKNLYEDLVSGPLVNVDGHVFARNAGNPSGQACTTPDNTLKNFMDMVVLWHLIMPSEYHSYELFKQFLIMCINGDDINLSVHPSIQDQFNVKAIREFMGQIDMEYHFASEEFRHNHECEFLGHAFKLCNIPSCGYAMYLPTIDCEKMRTSALIYNERHTWQETVVRACALRTETFACDSCRDWFGRLIDHLRNSLRQHVDHPDWTVCWSNFQSDAEFWRLYSGLEAVTVC